MRDPDCKQFTQAIIDDINAHIEGDHWGMILADSVPEGDFILNSVWEMQ